MRLRDNNVFRFWSFVGIPLMIIIIACFHQGGYYTHLINTFGIYIILVASLNLVNGFSGMFSMGHAAFMAIGAYVSAYFTLPTDIKYSFLPGLPHWLKDIQLPFLAAMLLGSIAAMLVALVVGFCVLRMKGHYLSVATLGLIVIVRSVLDNQDSITNGARGITGLPDHAVTWTIFFVAVVVMYILHRTIRSGFGRELIAIRDDTVAARTMGINVTKYRVLIFAMSAFFAGAGGALWGHLQSVISGKFYYYDMSFKIVQTSIIGGVYTLSGSIVGSLFMTFVPEFLSPLESGLQIFGVQLPEMYGLSNLIMAAFLVVLIIFRRQGLVGYSENIVNSIFSPDVYKAAVSPKEYKKLLGIIASKFTRLLHKKDNKS